MVSRSTYPLPGPKLLFHQMTDASDPELERCRRRVGSTLRDKWHIDDVIGIGGMAAVYSATHRIGRRDAIKILHPEIAVSKELRKRFEQEARAISQLGHAATVQVRDIDVTDDGAPFMVMELLEGESLGALSFRLGGIPEQELLRYVVTVLDVLNAAHERGIVHRDIKPDNLFITSAGEVRVLDFGIAHMKQGGAAALRTRTGALLGTTPYMAPEQILGKPIDGRADLYALGASMFRILAKRKIHEAESEAELLMQMGTMPAPSLRVVAPQISARVSLIVDRALAFNRDARYPSAAAMSADVQAVLGTKTPPLRRRALALGKHRLVQCTLLVLCRVGRSSLRSLSNRHLRLAHHCPWSRLGRRFNLIAGSQRRSRCRRS